MKIVTRLRAAAKAVASAFKAMTLSGVDSNRGWISLFRSNADNTWQTDVKITQDSVLTFSPVYSCITLIASDIAKICLRLMTQNKGIWVETASPAFSPLLRKPNHYQTRQQFIETWVLSKLTHGNAYILKQRDNRNVVTSLYVLDPNRVTPLVAPDGSVFYHVMRDDLSKLPFDMPAIPASEIIHDRMECLFHPLVGISPLIAGYLAASQGLRIQKNSEVFFKNMSRPSGILTAPGDISNETANRLKEAWDKNFGGSNSGKTAVVGNDLKYVPMTVNAVEAQLVDQLKLTAEQICSVFHVPPYMIGVGVLPKYDNIEALNQQYYTQCLQKMFNAIEDLVDDGLGLLSLGYRTEFELDDLLRMDTAGRVKAATDMVKASISAPNEERAKFGMLPADGGDSPMIQQQNYSLAAIAKRDAKEDPFKTEKPAAPEVPPAATDIATEASAKAMEAMLGVLTEIKSMAVARAIEEKALREEKAAFENEKASRAAEKQAIELLEYISKGLTCLT